MLASITPLGERGRKSRWGVTVGAFLLGAVAAGATAGAVAGAAGHVVLSDGVSMQARLLALSLVLVAALALELIAPEVPGPGRQVNEGWLDEFRGWVYGVGFGAQLGLGITTVVSSTATYVALLAAFLCGRPAAGALVFGVFGAIRGVTPLLAARVRAPEQLRAFHARFERAGTAVAPASLACLTGMTAAAILGSIG